MSRIGEEEHLILDQVYALKELITQIITNQNDLIQSVILIDSTGTGFGLDHSGGIMYAMDPRMKFDGANLKVSASVDVGTIDIGKTHIADPDTDNEAAVVSDGSNYALVVKQNSQPLASGAASNAVLSTRALETGGTLTHIKNNQLNGLQKSSITLTVLSDEKNTCSGVSVDPGAYWNTGATGSNTMGVNSIQIIIESTQNLTVYVFQGNGIKSMQLYDQYYYYASIGNFGRTVKAEGAYVRVVAKNTGLIAATISVDTVLCPIAEPLPRSLDEYGNLKIGLRSMRDLYGFDAENTPMGELRTIQPSRIVGANFEGSTIDTNFWISGVANNGDVSQAFATVTLSTKTTSANGIARLYTKRRARYVSGSSMCYRTVLQVSAPVTNNKRRWGIGYASTMPTTGTTDLITDGAFFQLDGEYFGVVLRRGGVANETKINSGSFNGMLGSIFTPGTTVKTYEIYWTNAHVYFVIGGIILHTFNADTTSWSSTMNFYIYNDNVNSNGLQTDHTLEVRVASIRRLGQLLTQPTHYYFPSGQTSGINLKLGAGNLHAIIVCNETNNAVITISDSISTTTPQIWTHTASSTRTDSYEIDTKGIPFYEGLRLTISGANACLTLIYE